MAMVTKLQQWGNSVGVRIPKVFAEEAQIRAGSTVEIGFENGELFIRPVHRKTYELRDLLKEVTKGNRHGEVDMGAPEGQEVW